MSLNDFKCAHSQWRKCVRPNEEMQKNAICRGALMRAQGCNPAHCPGCGGGRGAGKRLRSLAAVCNVTRVEMWVTRDANQHLIFAASAKKGLPFARTASSAGRVMRSTTLLLLALVAAAASAANYRHRKPPPALRLLPFCRRLSRPPPTDLFIYACPHFVSFFPFLLYSHPPDTWVACFSKYTQIIIWIEQSGFGFGGALNSEMCYKLTFVSVREFFCHPPIINVGLLFSSHQS